MVCTLSSGSAKSSTTFTRCSSTPSAETLVNAAGSMRRTRAASGATPLPSSMRAGMPGRMATPSSDSTSTTASRLRGSATSMQRRAERHHAFAFLHHLEHRAGDGRFHLPARADDLARALGAVAQQRRARLLHLVDRRVLGELGRLPALSRPSPAPAAPARARWRTRSPRRTASWRARGPSAPARPAPRPSAPRPRRAGAAPRRRRRAPRARAPCARRGRPACWA